jgi:hypothetical protein
MLSLSKGEATAAPHLGVVSLADERVLTAGNLPRVIFILISVTAAIRVAGAFGVPTNFLLLRIGGGLVF